MSVCFTTNRSDSDQKKIVKPYSANKYGENTIVEEKTGNDESNTNILADDCPKVRFTT